MNIVFMGTPQFAVPSLKKLIDSRHNVICVVCQPDKPSGRGKKLSSPPVKEIAEEHSIRTAQPARIKDDEFDHLIKDLSPDIICVVAYGKIIPPNILQNPQHGCINVHASLLPKYRGAAPINWAIINGESITGVTTMLMDEGMDTGDILLQSETKINEDETSAELSERLSEIGADLLLETIDKIEKNEIEPRKQDDEKASYAPILKKENGLIDWTKSATEIRDQIRGTQPWPGAYTKLEGKMLKLFRVKEISGSAGAPGKIIESDNGILRIGTGSCALDVQELQLEGSKRMGVEDFLRGKKIEKGKFLG